MNCYTPTRERDNEPATRKCPKCKVERDLYGTWYPQDGMLVCKECHKQKKGDD